MRRRLRRSSRGHSAQFARQRAAAISDVRYHLSFTVAPRAPAIAGHEELTFTLPAPQEVLLDYRDGTVTLVRVNGTAIPVGMANGHLELPAAHFRAGENRVSLDFTSSVAPAGKPCPERSRGSRAADRPTTNGALERFHN